ncbi:acyl carrier protein [Elusimicrobiota bacterium]
MSRDEISAKIKDFIRENHPRDELELQDTTDLLKDWFVDSLAIVEVVVFIEDNFDISLTRADVNGTNFKSIATMTEFVASRLSD